MNTKRRKSMFKNILMVSAVIALHAAFTEAGEKFICSEYDPNTEALQQKTVVLTSKTDLVEGKKLPFKMEVYEGASTFPESTFEGTAKVSDVHFSFSAKTGKTGFRMYLDEMNQSSLLISGKNEGQYICR